MAGTRYWRPNLMAASTAVFAVTAGINVANPLVPSFLHRELGVQDPGQIAFWSGVAFAVGPLSFALSSPFWGMLADRLGQRNALARAVLGAGLFTASLALVQSLGQLLVVRTLTGLTAGVHPGTQALVASETPPVHLARAFGILASARSLAQTLTPAIGGLAGSILPLRVVLGAAGLLMLTGLIPVLTRVRETSRPARGSPRPSLGEALRAGGGAATRAIGVIITTQGLGLAAATGSQQLLLVRVIEVDPRSATLVSGIAFAVMSLAAVLAGLACPWVVRAMGYRRLGSIATLALAAGAIASAHAASVAALIGGAAVLGAGIGLQGPVLMSMLGLETPAAVKGTIFGFGASAQQLGMAAGALGGGMVTIAIGSAGALYALAVTAVLGAGLLAASGREPPA